MSLSHILNNTTKLLKSNSPAILTAVGAVGVVTTAYLTGRATVQAVRTIDEMEQADRPMSYMDPPRERALRNAKVVWKLYIPPVASGAISVGCILAASRVNSRRTAAAVTAYSLGERAFSEYREKVVEQIGKTKEQAIRDSVAQARVANGEAGTLIITGKGDVTCCELPTGRYFKSDMETLRRAENEINAKINRERYVTLDEFYDIIGIPHTSKSDLLGWDSDKLMELKFSTCISPGGEPCLAFDYNYTKPL